MSKEIVCRSKCDRCGDLFDEESVDPRAMNEEDLPPLLVVEARADVAHDQIRFDDLCPKCINRVNNLLGQLALDKDEKGAEIGNGTKLPGSEGDKKDGAGENGASKSSKKKAKDRVPGASPSSN